MAGIAKRLKQLFVTRDPAAVLGRRRALTIQADGSHGRLLRSHFFQDQVMLPTVAKIVQIRKALPRFVDQLVQAHVLLVNVWRRVVVVGNSEEHGANLELVQVMVPPAEGDLQDPMEERERRRVSHEQATPDPRLDVRQFHKKPILSLAGPALPPEFVRPVSGFVERLTGGRVWTVVHTPPSARPS